MRTAHKLLLLLQSKPEIKEQPVRCEKCAAEGKCKGVAGKHVTYTCPQCEHQQEVNIA